MNNVTLPMISHKLVIAEKPSVAMSIAAVLGAKQRRDGFLLGAGWIVSWCVGHLVEPAMPQQYDDRYTKWQGADLPILPAPWRYTILEKSKKQFYLLNTLMNHPQVEEIVCATDAGREGELIFRLVYEQCACHKPVKRLWISSLEESAIREGFRHLREDGVYDRLYQAALCRQKADWLVGINASRLFSLIYGTTLNVGRVMTPTLSLIVQREEAIAHFQPESFSTVQISCGFLATSDRISDPAEARRMAAACSMKEAFVRDVVKKEKRERAPRLYDLTTLQRDANRIFGFTAQQTLDYAQALYEKKLITYPRTDSQYLTEDMAESLMELVSKAMNCFSYIQGMTLTVNALQVIDNSKVTDHHAIIPTATMSTQNWTNLPAQERALLELICNRLFCAVSDACEYDETAVTVECQGYTFHGKGKTMKRIGWKLPHDLFMRTLNSAEPSEKEDKPYNIQDLQIGQRLYPIISSVHEGTMSPPRHYTEDSLLAAMETAGLEDMPEDAERKGLGTPATRAGILEKLVQAGLMVRQGSGKARSLIPTDKGKALIAVMPPEITSAAMTAEWEQRLKAIERGEEDPDAFLAGIQEMLREMTRTAKPVPDMAKRFPTKRTRVGVCPVCGAPVAEFSGKGFFCENRICKFAIWKDNRFFTGKGKEVTKELVTELLEKRRVDMTGLVSEKTGKVYDATVLLSTDSEGRARFKLAFLKDDKDKEKEV